MNTFEQENAPHSAWEDDYENNVFDHNIGSSSPECFSDREDDHDEDRQSKRRKVHPNPVEVLCSNPDQFNIKDTPLVHQKNSIPTIHVITDEVEVQSIPVIPPKRKRGRPPGKKRLQKDAAIAAGTPIALSDAKDGTSSPLPFAIGTPPPSTSFVNNPNDMIPPPPVVPVKRGRGRPRKYPLPTAVTAAVKPLATSPLKILPSDEDLSCSVLQIVNKRKRLNSMIPTEDGASNHSFARFDLENPLSTEHDSLFSDGPAIPHSTYSSDSCPTLVKSSNLHRPDEDFPTPSSVLKDLEDLFGMDLSARKYFVSNVFDALSV